jgi:hypothetical protein
VLWLPANQRQPKRALRAVRLEDQDDEPNSNGFHQVSGNLKSLQECRIATRVSVHLLDEWDANLTLKPRQQAEALVAQPAARRGGC